MSAIKFEDLTEEQIKQFMMDGQMRIEHQFIDQSTPTSQEDLNKYYSKTMTDRFFEMAKNRQPNYYGMTDLWLYSALDAYPIKDKDVLIIGSTQPWYEVIALTFGAKSVTVSEYGEREEWHEKVKYTFYRKLATSYGDGRMLIKTLYPVHYDAIISISSFEHDGLGRYGDPLSPWADLEAMADAKCRLNPGGKLFLSVPVASDTLVWNAHRVYGPKRLERLLDGWNVKLAVGWDPHMLTVNMGAKADYQPVFVLEVK